MKQPSGSVKPQCVRRHTMNKEKYIEERVKLAFNQILSLSNIDARLKSGYVTVSLYSHEGMFPVAQIKSTHTEAYIDGMRFAKDFDSVQETIMNRIEKKIKETKLDDDSTITPGFQSDAK